MKYTRLIGHHYEPIPVKGKIALTVDDPAWLDSLIDRLRNTAMIKELQNEEALNRSNRVPDYAKCMIAELRQENARLRAVAFTGNLESKPGDDDNIRALTNDCHLFETELEEKSKALGFAKSTIEDLKGEISKLNKTVTALRLKKVKQPKKKSK